MEQISHSFSSTQLNKAFQIITQTFMKKSLSLSFLLLVVLLSNCRKIEVDGDNQVITNPTPDNLIISGEVNTDRTLKAGNTYLIKGIVYVTNGAKLTIEAGARILGEKSSRGTLVVTRGCQILANGKADNPIVFSSDATTPARGDWGGIVLLGRATTNANFNGVAGLGEAEGGINNGNGYGLYGGTDDNDNSGVLKYVRIEYAGYAFLPDKELNGLSFYAVGRGTTIDYVQVSFANDDSFEWFGGAVNCKHIIAYKGLDDDFDTDNGFKGTVQFAIGFRDSAVADISGSNGFESDNDAGGATLTPQTAPVFSNVTLVGPRANASSIGNTNFRRGIHIRRNSALSTFNSIVIGWPTGWLLDASTGRPTDLNIASGAMALAGTIFGGNSIQFTYAASASAPTGWKLDSVTAYINRDYGGNTVLAIISDVKLMNPFGYDQSVDFNPAAGSPALTGADFTNPKVNNLNFTVTTYRGAAAQNDNWWKSWTSFRLN
jgi:hypothetical protein